MIIEIVNHDPYQQKPSRTACAVLLRLLLVFGVAVAGGWIFASRTCFISVEQRYAAEGADMQEQFDQLVFGIPEQVTRVPSISFESCA